MKLRIIFTVLTLTTAFAKADPYLKKANKIKLVDACKSHCKKAKTNAETHECAERKGKIRKSFRKTNCWMVNEEYEELIEKSNKLKKDKKK